MQRYHHYYYHYYYYYHRHSRRCTSGAAAKDASRAPPHSDALDREGPANRHCANQD